jgi:tetratricopeptide (TPR) repeat protein
MSAVTFGFLLVGALFWLNAKLTQQQLQIISVGDGAYTEAIGEAYDLNKSRRDGAQIVVAGERALRYAKNPKDQSLAEFWIGLGYFRQERYEDAITHEDKAAALDPTVALPLRVKGDALILLQRSDEALVAYNAAIEREPDAGSHYIARAYAECNLRQTAAATADLERGATLRQQQNTGEEAATAFARKDIQDCIKTGRYIALSLGR